MNVWILYLYMHRYVYMYMYMRVSRENLKRELIEPFWDMYRPYKPEILESPALNL